MEFRVRFCVKRPTSILLSCLLLAGCGNADSFRETIGLNRKGPDEYQVVSRPPLTVPPDFNLVAPKDGAEYTPQVSAQEQAHRKVLGGGSDASQAPGVIAPGINAATSSAATSAFVPAVASDSLPSSADSRFLSNAGADKASKDIRNVLGGETDKAAAVKDSKYLISPSTTGDPLVDPVKEAQRLKDDKAQNKPPTTGETPVIAPQSKGILGDLF